MLIFQLELKYYLIDKFIFFHYACGQLIVQYYLQTGNPVGCTIALQLYTNINMFDVVCAQQKMTALLETLFPKCESTDF